MGAESLYRMMGQPVLPMFYQGQAQMPPQQGQQAPDFIDRLTQYAKSVGLGEVGKPLTPEERQRAIATGSRIVLSAGGMGGVEPEGEAGTIYYRGTEPGETRRISTGDPEWDQYLFITDNPKYARDYGSHIEEIRTKPEAKIIRENSPEWNRVVGKPRGRPYSYFDYVKGAVRKAKAAGFDLVHFQKQGDTGTVVLNENAIIRTGRQYRPSQGE